MELRQLRYFIAVAENLSFSKAAQLLHVTVPPLSRQIRQLEEEFDVRLFVRDRKHVALSDAGRLFLQEAKGLMAQAARMTDSVRMAKCGAVGLVRIGIGPGLGEHVSRVLVEHSKKYPAVELQYEEMFSGMQARPLLEGTIDVGFVRSVIDGARLEAEVLFLEKFAVHISKASPLARHRSLRVKDLAAETLLLPERRYCPALYDKTLKLYAEAGISPNILHVSLSPIPNGDTQIVHVASQKGIFIMPDESIGRPHPGGQVVCVPLDDPNAHIDVCVTWRKNEKSFAVTSFLESVRQVLRREPEEALAEDVRGSSALRAAAKSTERSLGFLRPAHRNA